MKTAIPEQLFHASLLFHFDKHLRRWKFVVWNMKKVGFIFTGIREGIGLFHMYRILTYLRRHIKFA